MTEPLKRRHQAATGATFASLVLISGALQALFESSEGPIRWVFLILAAILAGLIPFTPSWAELHRWQSRMRTIRWRRWLGWGLVWTLAVAGTVTLGGIAVPIAAGAAERAWVRYFGCDNATQLTLLAAPEDLITARELAAAFETDTARRRYGCPSANIQVYAESPAMVRDALVDGWSPDDLRVIGPRPDLWLTASTPHPADGDPLIPGQTTVVGLTPAILAVPQSLLVDPRLLDLRRMQAWHQLLDRAQDLAWAVHRPDPGLSAAAELATVAIYTSGPWPKPELSNPDGLRLIDLGRARQLERGLTSPAVPPGNGADLLCRHTSGALIVTEQQMVRYNAGLRLGCARPGERDDALRGFYPTDSLALPVALTQLTWPDSAQAQTERAAEFVAWLGTARGMQALNDTGLRSVGGHMRDPLSERNGALPVPYSLEDVAPEAFGQVAQARASAQRPARILLALDASGSMLESIGVAGQTRFDLAKQGIAGALTHIGPGDEFALWTFQGSAGPRQLTGFGAAGEAVSAELAGVAPSGGTPLYRSIVDGVAALSPVDPDRITALVVLTDGEDSGSGISRAVLLDAVRDRGVKVFVVATGEASCASRTIREVTELTAGSCYAVNVTSLDARLSALFGVLWGGS